MRNQLETLSDATEITTMTNAEFNMALELFRLSIAAGEKVKRNASKLAWLDATRRMGDAVIAFEADLARYETDAKAAAQRFSDYVTGWTTEDIVKVIKAA
jgi:hypothetical protein